MTELIVPAPVTSVEEAGWAVSIDGERVRVGHIRIENPKFGALSFGRRPEGTIGWGWKEVGGVGIVPYTVFGNKLHIGLVFQSRPFASSSLTLNIPRGFAKLASTFAESAASELREEVGLTEDLWVRRLESLGEVAANANSTFFDTTLGKGFRYFAFEAGYSEVEDKGDYLQFRTDLISRTEDPAEWIDGCKFYPWNLAAKFEDNFTAAGVARLLAAKPQLTAFL